VPVKSYCSCLLLAKQERLAGLWKLTLFKESNFALLVGNALQVCNSSTTHHLLLNL